MYIKPTNMMFWKLYPFVSSKTGFCFMMLIVAMATTIMAEEENTLILDPPKEIAIEVGKSGEVTCGLPEGATTTETLMWLNENGTNVNDFNITQVKEQDGTLKLEDMTEAFSGHYTCTTVTRAYNSTVTVRVYVMPNYFVEGMVIIGINAALVLVFIGCGTYRLIQTRRETNREKKLNRRM